MSGLLTPGRNFEYLAEDRWSVRSGLVNPELYERWEAMELAVDEQGNIVISDEDLNIIEALDFKPAAIERLENLALREDDDDELEAIGGWPLETAEIARWTAEDDDALEAWKAEEFRRCCDPQHGFEYLVERYGGHAPADGTGWQRLDLFGYQRQLIRLLAKEDLITVLKSRRAGFTLLVCWFMVWETCFRSDTPGAKWNSVSTKAVFAAEIIATCRTIIANLPHYLRPVIGDEGKGADGRRGKNQSGAFQILARADGRERTAEIRALTTSEDGARSLTGRVFFDELGHYRNGLADQYYKSTVPIIEGRAGKRGKVIVGSSGNGESGNGKTLFELWKASTSRDPETGKMLSPFAAAFIPFWAREDRVQLHTVEEYTRAFDSNDPETYMSEWAAGVRAEVYSEPWFRQQVVLLNHDEEYARQEYCADEADALIGDRKGLFLPPDEVEAVKTLGEKYDKLRLAGQLPEPVGGLFILGVDWESHSATVFGHPIEGGGLYIYAELHEYRVPPRPHTANVVEVAEGLGHRIGLAFGDGSSPMSCDEMEDVLRRHYRWAEVRGLASGGGKKKERCRVLREFTGNTARGDYYRKLAVSPTGAPVLLGKLRDHKQDAQGLPIKDGTEHPIDALLFLMQWAMDRQ